jgi:hypothetical protein
MPSRRPFGHGLSCTREMQRVVEPGIFDVMMGTSSETTLSATLEVRAR